MPKLWNFCYKSLSTEDENGETSTSFVLETEKLQKLLKAEEVADRKIIIISVTGAFRTGKSFLLNYLLLYLRHLEAGGKSDWLAGLGKSFCLWGPIIVYYPLIRSFIFVKNDKSYSRSDFYSEV